MQRIVALVIINVGTMVHAKRRKTIRDKRDKARKREVLRGRCARCRHEFNMTTLDRNRGHCARCDTLVGNHYDISKTYTDLLRQYSSHARIADQLENDSERQHQQERVENMLMRPEEFAAQAESASDPDYECDDESDSKETDEDEPVAVHMHDPIGQGLAELKGPTTQESIALTYACALRQKVPSDRYWVLNRAIVGKWGVEALKRIKTKAWKMFRSS